MRLKELRKTKKVRQSEVAEVINCSQAVYSRYENGERTPSPDTLKALAAYFGVTVDYILGRDDLFQEDVGTKKEPIPEDEQSAEYMKLWPKMTKKDRDFILHMMRKMDEENNK